MPDTPRPDDFWKSPATPVGAGHWVDPYKEVRGMLSAQYIQRYVEQTQMIEQFDEENLKTSSYRLTVGRWAQVEGRNVVLTTEAPFLDIPPNSIAFVSVRERLRLPHYIAARFNLMIDLVYKGLLLGTGPQVDPGFQGVLSFPLHNLSNNPIRLEFGKHVATIDFVKTTGMDSRLLIDEIHSEKELYAAAERDNVRLFQQSKRWIRPIVGYQPGPGRISSSVQRLDQRIRTIERRDVFAIAGLFVAFVALILAFSGINWTMFQAQQTLTSQGADLRAEQVRLQQGEDQIRSCLRVIVTSARPVPGATPSPPPICVSP